MLLSQEFPMRFRGKHATLRVVRNNGHCWAEVSQGAEAFSISTNKDHYDDTDEDAAAAFIRAARQPSCVSKSLLLGGTSRETGGEALAKGGYVVIYDRGDFEEYYGYFGSPDEAEKVFTEFAEGHEKSKHKIRNAKLCRIVGPMPGKFGKEADDDEGEPPQRTKPRKKKARRGDRRGSIDHMPEDRSRGY
jgi:hypothetical protein